MNLRGRRAISLFVLLVLAIYTRASAQGESPQTAANQITQLIEQNQFQEAIDAANLAVAQWPRDAQIHHLLGLAYFKNGDLAGAGEELMQAVKLAPNQADMHYDLALSELAVKKYAEAATQLEQSNRLDPSNALAHLLLGRAYLNTNRTLQALAQFQQALKIEPGISLGHYHLGFVYETLGKNREAIAEFQKEVAADPNSAETLYQLGHTLLESGELEGSVATLERCLALEQRFDAQYDLGKAYLLEHKFPESIETLKKAIELNPNDASSHYQLAHAFEATGDKTSAEMELQQFRALKAAQHTEGGMASGRVIK